MSRPRDLVRPVSGWTRGVLLPGALLLTALATGCGGPSELPTPAPADRSACAALVEALPDTLADEERVAVKPERYAAGWGDPTITLSCGVGVPDGFGPASSCLQADGVDWFGQDEETTDNDADVTLTSVTLTPRVAVRFPAAYRGASLAAALSELAIPLREHLRVGAACQ